MLNEHQKILNTIDSNIKIEKRFIGGMSNYTYLCSDGENKYAFRVKGEGGENFVDYFLEAKNIKLVDKLGINSTTVKLIPEEGIKLAKYIEGEMLDNSIDLNRIVEVLKTLHTSDIKFEDYNHFARLEKYEAIHNNKVDKYSELKDKFLEIYNNHLVDHVTYPCHNDSQIANFILSDTNKIYLLDWEFAGQNDFIYDIASFGNVDFGRAVELLGTYFDNPTNEHYLRLYAWRMFQCLQWFNVASFKHESGMSEKLNVPFDKVSEKYINLAQEMFEKANTYL